MSRIPLAVAILLAGPLPAMAQVVTPCTDSWVSQAENITEPWEQNIRSFASGAVRVALLDTVEPAGTPFYLLILSPPHDELGARQCRIVGSATGSGFASIEFASIAAEYDPGHGLTLDLPARLYDERSTDLPTPYRMSLSINQATGDIAVTLAPG